MIFSERVHFSSFLMPHLFRLSGVFSPFVHAFNAKDKMPLGMLLLMLFQVTFACSLINRLKKSPWKVNFLTLSFQLFNVSTFPASFILFIAASTLKIWRGLSSCESISEVGSDVLDPIRCTFVMVECFRVHRNFLSNREFTAWFTTKSPFERIIAWLPALASV